MKVQLPEGVKTVVDHIIASKKYKNPTEINVSKGCEAGDGYASESFAVSIKSEGYKTLNLFTKSLPETLTGVFKEAFNEVYYTEYRFYNEILPALEHFQRKRNVREPFDNVPKHFSSDVSKFDPPPIILENLKDAGYILRDRQAPFDEDSLKLPIAAFAKYHGLNYAMKDQEPELYKKLSVNIEDFLKNIYTKFGIDKIVEKGVEQLIGALDSVGDHKLLERCKDLADIINERCNQIQNQVDEYSIIAKGDCWCNNMMYLYDKKTGHPIDVKLIDWQCLRFNSPLLDFSYFFYTLANKEVLDQADFYISFYYNTMSQMIRELGSDPDKVFPYDVFKQHLKKFAVFGLAMAFNIVKIQLYEKDEIPDLTKETVESATDALGKPLKNQDQFIERMKDLVQYFIDNELV